MATNILPSGIGDLFQLAEGMEKGLTRHGAWILQDPTCAEDFSRFFKLTRDAEETFLSARAEKAAAGQRFAEADAALTTWLAKARLVVMLASGSRWSESWLAAGFTHRGTSVPKRIGPRIELSRRLSDFFSHRGEYEVPFADVTAAEACRLQRAIKTADEVVRLTRQDVAQKKRVRDAAEKKLRHEMHFVVAFLGALLGKSDPRWLAFGLKRPRPEAVAAERRPVALQSAPVAIDFAGSPAIPVARTRAA